MELIFATNNAHKVKEMQAAIGQSLKIISLAEAGITREIPEPHDTLEDNAREKARTIHQLTGKNCFSEDTGLETTALGGEPGVHSARYAGNDASFNDNINKLLDRLGAIPDRSARFRTVIALIWEGKEYLFEGICEGEITKERRGDEGFGYDPVFLPKGSTRSFGEMTLEEKNRYSHRRKAADKLVLFLQQQLKTISKV